MTWIGIVACAGLVAYKLVLARLQNINWDEFYFLSHVYSLARGDLTLLMLGAYTHLFRWLIEVPGGEIHQIIVARSVMTLLLALTAWLIWRLGRIWLRGSAALVPPFVYLSAMPVLQHGGSFRFDSMLAPLSVAAILLLLAPGHGRQRDLVAGGLLGLAFAITVKVVLFAPLLLVAVLFRHQLDGVRRSFESREAMVTLLRIGITAGAVAVALLGLHRLTITPTEADSVANFATHSARITLIDTPWFPRLGFLQRYVDWQPLPWVLIGLGTLVALLRRQFALAALSLALLPVVFYRNAFPYYYLVMLAPACVLAGYALQEVVGLVRPRVSPPITTALLMTVWAGLLYQGLAYTKRFYVDDIWAQRMLLTAVHQVFPEPVEYIDRCGMVPSFRKVNFFMSTWGMKNYLAKNEPFMPELLRTSRPAFVLMNAYALYPNRTDEQGALPEDRELLTRFYPKYWGPLRVAGASASVPRGAGVRVEVPFAADYRLESKEAVYVDGALRQPGDVIRVTPSGVEIRAPETSAGTPGPVEVHLFLAAARSRPTWALPQWPLFANL